MLIEFYDKKNKITGLQEVDGMIKHQVINLSPEIRLHVKEVQSISKGYCGKVIVEFHDTSVPVPSEEWVWIEVRK
ncbi:hypothetical protein [Vibrio sp. CUB2]|uniref:hypothetical protein n=1 Tax=Vibrio sp. CUB2 TaxID=2315233 RepID=UPI00076A292B|nr:hypothetical protein [Vibrio sp. CUB2]